MIIYCWTGNVCLSRIGDLFGLQLGVRSEKQIARAQLFRVVYCNVKKRRSKLWQLDEINDFLSSSHGNKVLQSAGESAIHGLWKGIPSPRQRLCTVCMAIRYALDYCNMSRRSGMMYTAPISTLPGASPSYGSMFRGARKYCRRMGSAPCQDKVIKGNSQRFVAHKKNLLSNRILY
jgi:hypothetical protein